ncbi:MAG TPA: V-type ATP synthase subunit F [Oscillospiraceae bacterium]|nr:V-type ATP synthase subunit F [Oscillospiraceae bacterium]HPF56967.1 V-type ATP synthase subunit F [Clostridiales bacterium]HPK34800.1 V-type ATP synthase subunit F [Oscillospiraceae bacterium]HPR75850.1 V-type ATP synthase subunit F [Oscillospiraceae bacterium]
MTGKIAVIGDRDSILAFNALGVTVFATSDEREASRKIAELEKEHYAIIFITEPLAEKLEPVFAAYRNQTTPALILIPNNAGSTGKGLAAVKASVERAIGTDIFKQQ